VKGYVFLIVLGVILYFGLRTEAPTPAKPWQPYAANSGGKLEWFLSTYATEAECSFYREKTLRGDIFGYGQPSGCLYEGYQNPYIQWIVNSFVGYGMFKCIARMKNRNKFDDPIYSPVLRDYPSDHSEDWDCVW
jgi:hypothetical protein